MAYLCRTWEDSCDFTLTCLNVLLNIIPSCGNICISGLRCRPSVQLALVTTSPSLPYRIISHQTMIQPNSFNLFGNTRMSSCREKNPEMSLCFQYNRSNHCRIGNPDRVFATKMVIRKLLEHIYVTLIIIIINLYFRLVVHTQHKLTSM